MDQISPVHPASESKGGVGPLSVTEEEKDERTKEILVSNLGGIKANQSQTNPPYLHTCDSCKDCLHKLSVQPMLSLG